MVHQIGMPNVIWWTHSAPLWAPVKSGARHYDDVYSLHSYVYDFTSFACVCIGGVVYVYGLWKRIYGVVWCCIWSFPLFVLFLFSSAVQLLVLLYYSTFLQKIVH
jgi:hypothetical protein